MNRKEEINRILQDLEVDHEPGGGGWIDEDSRTIVYHNLLRLTSSYAKEIAIGFAEWISNHRLDFQPATKGNFIGVDMVTYPPSELFDQYLKSLNDA